MKKFLLILLLVVIAIAGIFGFLFYQTIDEKSYQQQIVSSAQQLLGRQLQVNGQLSIKLFPSPVITLTDVSILNPQGFKNKNLIHIEKVQADVQFSSLFKNPLVVQNITLVKPHIFLEKNEQGKINWDFAFLRPDLRRVSQDNLLGQKVNDVPPQFQNMDIKEGQLTYLNQPLQTNTFLTDITGQLKADTIKGPFDFKGQVKIDQMPVQTILHIDMLGADVETKFSVSLSAPNSKATLSVQSASIIRLAEPTQEISGSFAMTVPSLSSFLNDVKGYKDLPLEMDKQITGGGRFLFSSKQTVFDELAFVYGDVNSDIATSGKISVDYPVSEKDKKKTSVVLRFSQLNLDLLSPYMPKKSPAEELFTVMPQKLPDNLEFWVSSEKLTLLNGQLSKIDLKGRYRDNVMNIFEFSTFLPENVELTAKGDIDTKEKNAKLNLSLKGKDLKTTYEWAKVSTPFIKNAAALHDADITALLEMTPENLTLSNINAKIAGGQISGNLSYSLTATQPTAFVGLNLKSLNLDNFVPSQSTQEKLTLKQALNHFKTYMESSVLFSDVDVVFSLTANDITFKNLPIQKMTYKGKIKSGEWTTEEMDIKQIATADIRYSGTMRKDANGLAFDNVNASINIPKASIFFERLKMQSPTPSSMSKLTANATINGTFNQMNLKAQTALSQGKLQFDGTIRDVLSENSPYQMKVNASFPSLTQFVRLFQPSYKGHPNLTGLFNFDGTISGGLNTLSFKDAALEIGPQKANFNLDIKQDDTLVKATGNISSPWLYLDKFVVDDDASSNTSYSKDLLDFSSMDNLQLDIRLSAQKASWENFETNDFASHLLLNQKILQIQDTKAKIEQGTISFNSTLNFSASTPYLKGQLELASVPMTPNFLSLSSLRLRQGTASFKTDFNAKGNSVDDMMRSLSANGQFNIQNGIISGMNLPSFERRSQAMIIRTDVAENINNILQREFFTGETSFEKLTGTFAVSNGLLRSTDAVMKAQNANALIQADWNIPQMYLSSSGAISFSNLTGYPPVALSIKGNLRNLKTSLDLTSFIKYIENSASDTRNELIRKQREEEMQRRQKEASSRVQQIAQLTAQAEKQLNQAQKALQLAPSETAQAQLVRANDAFVLLQELSNKTAPSEADAAKASVQASQITSRTQAILNEVNEKASKALRQEIAKNMETTQQQFYAITRVYQRLSNVEIVYQAYQKASSSFIQMQQLNEKAATEQNIDALQSISEQINKEAEIIDLTYQSIAKYDVDAQGSGAYYETSSSVQGSIRRN